MRGPADLPEEQLDAQQEFMELLVAGQPDLSLVLSPDFRIRYASPAAVPLLGTSPQSMQGARAFDFVHVLDRGELRQQVEAVQDLAGARPPCITRLRHPKHGWRLVEFEVQPFNTPGEAGGVLLVGRALPENGVRWTELHTDAERFRTLIERSCDLVILLDGQNRVSFASPSLSSFSAFNCREVRGEPMHSLLAEPDREAMAQALRDAQTVPGMPVGLPNFRLTRQRDDRQWTGRIISMLDDPAVEGILVLCENVSSKHLAESALQAAHRRTRRHQNAILHLATHRFLASGDLDKAFAVITETAAAALHVERCSVWLMSDDDLELRCADLFEWTEKEHSQGMVLRAPDYPRYFQALRSSRVIDASAAQTDPRTVEFSGDYLKPQGITSMLDATIRVAGRSVGVICFEHCGEARTWQADELAFSGEVADQVVQALHARQQHEATRTQAELEEQLARAHRLRTVGTVAGGIAHDFNNILTPITAYAELALATLDEDHPARRHLARILEGTGRASSLSSQLLTFSSPPGDTETRAEVAEICGEVRQLLAASLTAKVHTTLDIDAACPAANADPTQVHQLLMNLCVNAAQAMGEAGGEIRIGLSRSLFPERCKQAGAPAVHLRVQDDGPGMDAETQKRVFDPFFSTKKKGEGSGLGLSVVRGIVRGCNGLVELDSEPGKGACFDIYLPVATTAANQPAHESTVPDCGQGRILVVDDEMTVANVVGEQLESLGYEVVVFYSGTDALEHFSAASADFDLILSDQTMPGMRGSEFLSRVRELRPDLPTVLMSGLDVVPGDHAGYADRVLAKPLRIQVLATVIGEQLADAQTRNSS